MVMPRGEDLYLACKRLGLTHAELATLAGVHPKTADQWCYLGTDELPNLRAPGRSIVLALIDLASRPDIHRFALHLGRLLTRTVNERGLTTARAQLLELAGPPGAAAK